MLAVGAEVGELQTGWVGRFHAPKQRVSHNAAFGRLRARRANQPPNHSRLRCHAPPDMLDEVNAVLVDIATQVVFKNPVPAQEYATVTKCRSRVSRAGARASAG